MQGLLVLLLFITSITQLCTGQQKQQTRHGSDTAGLDMRLRGLEEKLQNQQFELNQLKKELLARDEEIHALTEMIEGDPSADQNSEQQNDDTFEVQSDSCNSTRFVHFGRPAHRPGKAKRISVIIN